MGSAVSLRSNGSKEAWVERNEQDVQDLEMPNSSRKGKFGSTFSLSRGNKVTPGDVPASAITNLASLDSAQSNAADGQAEKQTGSSLVSSHASKATSLGEKDRPASASNSRPSSSLARLHDADQKDGLKGVKVEVEEDCPEKHAYIPYLYARNCIAKIMEDMKAMKQNHLVIVENIQMHYGEIESETQEQFNMFVLCIRDEYASQRQTFRKVIDTHKDEVEKKEKYWNEMLQSLAERNNRLLREKKMLLIHSKTEIEKLEKEKEGLQEKLSGVVVPAPVPVPEAWEEERKLLQDQLETEKANVASLEKQMASMSKPSDTPVKLEVATASSKETAVNAAAGAVGFGAGAMATAGVMAATKENNKQVEKERHEIVEERKKLSEERAKVDAEREGFGAEQQKWMDEINKLQTELAEKNVSGNEWKVKHDVLQGRLEEVAGIQAKYQMLENQYAALALLVKGTDTSAALTENMGKNEEEKKMMNDEKSRLDNDINKWEKDFEKKNGRKPAEDDKTDMVKEMYTTREEVTYMVTSLQQKEDTFKKVQAGGVPDVPEVPHKPVDTTDPEVVTVQVKVPDPTVVEELKQTQTTIITIRTEITTLQQEITELRTEISEQNETLAKQRENIAGLEHQIATMKAEGVATGAGLGVAGTAGISNEELEELKNENRALRRDMKKMIKQYERLSERQQTGGGDSTDEVKEMSAALSALDNKVADLESENEALKEERLVLRERVKTITETITVTHFEENKKNLDEKDKRIEELIAEIKKLREENVSMTKDMKKMVKAHSKTKGRLNELLSAEKAVKLLEIVAMLIHEIHTEVPDAAGKVNSRLVDAQTDVSQLKQVLDTKQAAYQAWVDAYQQKHNKIPGKEERRWKKMTLEESVTLRIFRGDKNGEFYHDEWDQAKHDFKEKHLFMSALLLMKTGDVNEAVGADGTAEKTDVDIENLEKALSLADNQIIDLEAKAQNLNDEKNRYKDKVDDLEKMIVDMQKQAELNATLMADATSSAELTEQLSDLQKKADNFEAELMQERMSHVNTRDELETVRKQMDVLKEEMENEKAGMEARLNTAKAGLEAQLDVKNEEIESLKLKTDELETEKLSKLPPDSAAEIKKLQDKLKNLEQDKSSNKSSSVALNSQVAELTSQLEVASKHLETQRAANRELEAKLKANRLEKDKETKKMSRHLEEKQQKTANEDKQRITMLVKRVKELESKAGKGTNIVPVPVGGGGGGDKHGTAEVHMLKREIKDQAAEIKRLEKEIKFGGGAAGGKGGDVADKKKLAQHEKILKELEKRMDFEKEKSGKLMEGLKAADEENKGLKKELDEKNRILTKLTAEMKTISVAAKEGIEAAGKVKELETENKKLGEENIVLTKNFESERVLRKKYYNMVEDMKGKIRVYCRARPMSKSELDRGNKPVCKSGDEYTISVEATRGLKEFQYDAVFMEDSTQEKIFEDTNNLIQSAVDGYNVCIFAYGQTGSGKTFTMIGDKDQKFPGIAPRAFNRIFELIDELKSKFTITVEAYMLELYNDKLIDLFAKPGSEDDKLDIKKDKKGMVFIQGAIIKTAKNSKELFALFEEGSTNRHVASTKMNAESSRSHLVVGIVMEATNKNTGNVTKGKLSLVDLAGSERVGKTGAGAEQLKEAMSINKSLSALGDVISALSSDQQFIPYRNNKLTMLMQDSLGGNAKTLMFVNISPADYNMDETVISLTYASRVKLITNDASKNADNKEIARLRNIIDKLKKGEAVQEEEI
ncbi:nuclear anchorage protein 1-like [Ruditapes philippinarum]|uniref:nuclear anchorage protein 1-like n=1 Tax=Ruditapes philippinarum TaxID=129788 RepID=UPI00295A871B|nr:nuclear anchorage protein 1-like [Ruditapes philippinarum]